MTTNEGSPRRWVRWVFAGVFGLAAAVFVVGLWSGCRQYAPASSPESLACIKLLYAACSAKDETRLAEVERRAAALTTEGKMTASEKAGFDQVVGWAKAGEWQRAEDAAFKMAQDQVGVGHPSPTEPKAKPTKRK